MTRRQAIKLAAASVARATGPAITKADVFPSPYPVAAHFKFFTKPQRDSIASDTMKFLPSLTGGITH